jgi:PAS domain-containing protein
VFLCRVPRDGRRLTLAKLIDFGLARPHIDDAEVDESERAGTPEFAAPEQFQGAGPLPSMDIYALGVLLFEMVTGQMAFEGTPEQVVRLKMKSPPPSPNDRLRKPLDPGVTRLITRVMAVDPSLRPQSVEELIHELRVLADAFDEHGVRRAQDNTDTIQVAAAGHLVGGAKPVLGETPPLSLAACPVPTCVVGPDRAVVVANEAFSDLVCLPESQLLGTPVADTLLSAVYPDVEAAIREVLKTGTPRQHSLALDSSVGQPSRAYVWLVPFKPEPTDPVNVWFSILMAH